MLLNCNIPINMNILISIFTIYMRKARSINWVNVVFLARK